MFLALAAFGLASCNGGFKKGDGGMLYKIVVDKGGPSIKEGDFASITYSIKNDADSLMASSNDLGGSQLTKIQKASYKGDILAGIAMLAEGDSAIIKINMDSLAKSQGHVKDKNFKGKYVVYSIKIDKVIAKGNLSEQVFEGRLEDYLKKEEAAKIQGYLAAHKDVVKGDSGLYYVITKQGFGPKPVEGDTAVVNYTGMFLNGKPFETSVKSDAIKYKMPMNPMNPYKPYRFPVGTKNMIKGWNLGIPMLTKGATATLILPSSVAYGERGSQQIPPFTPLIFNVELVDIIHPNPNAPKPVAMVPPVQQPIKR